MFDSQHFQQHSSWKSSAFTDCMIASVEHGQCETLPPINPCRVSANLGFNGFEFSCLPDKDLTVENNGSIRRSLPNIQTLLTPNHGHGERSSLNQAKASEKPSVGEVPQQKRFLIFDRSGNETRLIFSSLCPRVEDRTNPPTTCPALNPEESIGAYHPHFIGGKQGSILGQAWTRTPALYEESGENEIIDDVSKVNEDSDEINALLYSDDDDSGGGNNDLNYDYDDGDDDDDDDEVSSGHSPLFTHTDPEKQEDEDDFDIEVASKRQKSFHGGCKRLHQGSPYEDVNDGDLIGVLKESVCPIVGNKRQRTDKIHDTLKVLERIIPGLKSKDPLVILDEAISYLKYLKYNAETMSIEEDPDSSTCHQPSQ